MNDDKETRGYIYSLERKIDALTAEVRAWRYYFEKPNSPNALNALRNAQLTMKIRKVLPEDTKSD